MSENEHKSTFTVFHWTNILFPRQEYEVQMIYGGIDLEYLKYWFKRTNFLL